MLWSICTSRPPIFVYLALLIPLVWTTSCSSGDLTDPPPESSGDAGPSNLRDAGSNSTTNSTNRGPDTRPISDDTGPKRDAPPGMSDSANCPSGRTCSRSGARTCNGKEVLECQTNRSGCTVWERVETCTAKQICANGQCQSDCTNRCDSTNRSRCVNEQVQQCGDHDGDPCLEWDEGSDCPTGKTCSKGDCVPNCRDQCQKDNRRCSNDTVQVCADQDGDTCLEWIDATTCMSGTTCSSASCVSSCSDQCQQSETRCSNDAVQTCDNHDRDSCLEWGGDSSCGSGEICSNGQCTSSCNDQCQQGNKRCSNNRIQTCANHDSDACLEWGGGSQCGSGTTCSNGMCVSSCSDQCPSQGKTRCSSGKVETCDTHDGDSCLEWGGGSSCGSGTTCSMGTCMPSSGCSDQCSQRGARQCAGHGYKVCDDHDGDSCLEPGPQQFCSAGEVCQSGMCQSVSTPPSQLVISEVLYDGKGRDQDVFIELKGTPDTDLSGFEIVGVNGSTGNEYDDIVLKGKTDSNGLFLVVYNQASSSLQNKAQQVSSEANLQNGPDNVQIRWNSTTVDALGYGSFSSVNFAGEGSPHPGVSPGKSVARYGSENDTGDNAADFYTSTSPTPGQINPKSKP